MPHALVSIPHRTPENLHLVKARRPGTLQPRASHKQQHNATRFLRVETAFQLVPDPSTDFEGHISTPKFPDVFSSGQTTLSSLLPCILIPSRTGHAQPSAGQHIQQEDSFA